MPFDASVYRLASIAREKLCLEAAKDSHNLRALVAHANLLDELLVELSAPKGGKAEYYGFDLLPRPVTEATMTYPARPIVVTVMEENEQEMKDEGLLTPSTHMESPSTLPPLCHEYTESDSDSGSDSDSVSEDGDNFETEITSHSPPTSPASSLSATSEDDVEPNESDLGLHRTKSGWRLLGNWPSKQYSKRDDSPSAGTITKGIQQVSLTTT